MKKSKLFWVLPAMALAMFGWVVLPVQAAEQRQWPTFSEVDKDKDGQISPTEAVAVPGLVEVLAQLDRNLDAKVTKDEYDIAKSAGPQAMEHL